VLIPALAVNRKPASGIFFTSRGSRRENPRLSHGTRWENPCVYDQTASGELFPGQYFDVETGLHYNYFRDYDPSIGRYVQSDPIGLGSGSNTYLYVTANPLENSDRFGLHNLIVGVGGSAVAGLGADVSSGIVVNIDSTDVLSNVAQFGSAGIGAGFNVSGDVFGGVISGEIENVEGVTDNINLVLPGVSVTIITKNGVGPIGVTFGIGRSLTRGGLSVSRNSTGIASIERYLEIVETIIEQLRNFPGTLVRASRPRDAPICKR
jgi:RHS repeat-associated protein